MTWRNDILSLAATAAMLLGLLIAPAAGQATSQAATAADTQPAAQTQPATAPAVAAAHGSDLENSYVKTPGASRAKSAGDWTQTLAALAAVIGLIFAARLLVRRVGGTQNDARRNGPLEVIARSVVAPKQQLLVVRLGRRLMLVGCGPAGFASLGEVTDEQEVEQIIQAAREAQAASLGAGLKKKLDRLASPAANDAAQSGDAPRDLAGRMHGRLAEEDRA